MWSSEEAHRHRFSPPHAAAPHRESPFDKNYGTMTRQERVCKTAGLEHRRHAKMNAGALVSRGALP